ncbi:MAG: ribbon-helix-helix protein, CopG family [Verrucomicrobiota bacterium]|nr:ribbon-helix-helix protein, CopG family [Verrucomicrobiota bacterium]
MSQITIYLDETLIHEVKVAARKEKKSVSEWMKDSAIKNLKNNEWSEDFLKTFGAISDETFIRHPQPAQSSDDYPRFD